MNAYITTALALFCALSSPLFAAKQAGSVAQIKGKEIIVKYADAGSPMQIGEKLTAAVPQGTIVLEVVFPMQSAAKCRVLSGDSSLLKPGTALTFDTSGILKETGNMLFPVDGVFPGRTAPWELAKLGKKQNDPRDGKGTGYEINGAIASCDITNTIVSSYYLTSYDKMPQKWRDLGMDLSLSYDEWTALAQKLGWKIKNLEPPHTEKYGDNDSFSAIMQLQYVDSGIVYLLTLNFNFGKGTTSADKDTLHSIDVIFASKYDQKEIDEVMKGNNSLFPLDGVTIGKTTPYQLSRLGNMIPDNDKARGPAGIGMGSGYIVNGTNVWCDKGNSYAYRYYFITRDFIPYKWQALGFDMNLSYNECMNLAEKKGWEISVIEEPHNKPYEEHDSFAARIIMRAAEKGIVSLIKLDFSYSTGTMPSDKGTLFSMEVLYSSSYNQKEVDDAAAGKNMLFPLDGIIPGQTTIKELSKVGKCATNKDDTGKLYTYYSLNGYTAWYDAELNIVTNDSFTRSDITPEKWKKLGLNWNLSYSDWVSLGHKLGWTVNTIVEPHLVTRNDTTSFEAKLELCCPQGEYTSVLTLTFMSRDKTSQYDEGTLLMATAGISNFNLCEMKAKRGNHASEYYLSNCYAKGDGTEKNQELAAQWCLKAANAGYADAEYNMGCYYYDGEGVEENKKMAIVFFTRAANKGHRNALYNLGVCYFNGYEVEKNQYKAVECWKQASQKNDPESMNNLGSCYENGTGVQQDQNKAIELYKKAAILGNDKAKGNLSRLGIGY